jgi:hypothetical protein
MSPKIVLKSSEQQSFWKQAKAALGMDQFRVGGREFRLWITKVDGRKYVLLWLGGSEHFIDMLDPDPELLERLAPRLAFSFSDPTALALAKLAIDGKLSLVMGDEDATMLLIAAIRNTEALTGNRLEDVFLDRGPEGGGT